MKIQDLQKLIREEVRKVLAVNEAEDFGAFRRVLITTSMHAKLKTDIEAFMKRPEIKSQYPVKFTIKPGVKPSTLVIDIEGKGATVIGTKVADLAKKMDKNVIIKIKQTIKRVPAADAKPIK
jgi:hypothetical protein